MEQKSVVYVAGNPDAYPLEYYNKDTETYEGVIPKLLEEFSNQSPYEVIYYQADGTDHREHLAQNNQVDILSGYSRVGDVSHDAENVVLFHTIQDGEDVSYCLYFTDAAPEDLKVALETFLDSVSQEQVSGLLVDTVAAQAEQNNETLFWTIGSLGLVIVLLLTAIVLIVRNYRKKLKKAKQDMESDEVTGLGNLDYFTRYYNQFVNDKNRIIYQLFYFYVDTDRLRRIADNQETNEFLRFCAVVLQEHTGDADILVRVSDHGFAMLKLTNDEKQIDIWVKTILERIRGYTQLYAKTFDVNMGVGLYPLKSTDRDVNAMIFNASQGAYMADKNDEDYVVCSDGMIQKFAQEKQLQASIEQAFENHEFELYIQFYVDTDSYKIVGGEALSRWNHPQKGMLNPNVFVPLMEREKMISKLDYYCLRKVCIFLHDLVEQKVDRFFVSCNFSRETFAAVDFADRVKEIIDAYHFPRELLILEITESSSVKNTAQIQHNIKVLKNYGVSVALDDFGEGFTSFYDLQKYPINGIKLDKGLIDQIMTPSGSAVVKAMIQVGHELDMTILAEGVETEDQVKALRAMHCDVIQGFHFYIPLPEWEAKNQILNQFFQ
ncbi:MAG: EAL domain-containing protein [Massiliimalia sp.]